MPAEGTCGHNNLVYLFTCKKCSKQYVGETSVTINCRFYYHFYDIKNLKYSESAPSSAFDKTYDPMTKHFVKDDYSQEDISIQIAEHIKLPPHSKTYRLGREFFWMQQLKTVQPLGINSMEVSKWLLARR